jgi:hypothetical protein
MNLQKLQISHKKKKRKREKERGPPGHAIGQDQT